MDDPLEIYTKSVRSISSGWVDRIVTWERRSLQDRVMEHEGRVWMGSLHEAAVVVLEL
jgi:hypothetical protein